MKKIRNNTSKKRIIMILFILICIGGLIYSTFNMFRWKRDVNRNNQIKEDIQEFIKIDDRVIEYGKVTKLNIYQVDFDKLKERNSDTVGYIKVRGTNIDYPVLKTKDNSYYLDHNFYKQRNSAGWIFADYRNKYDGTDRNLIIYGHNMFDGSMFGSMGIILDGTWQDTLDNRQVILVSPNDNSVYEVFSTYVIKPEEYYITTEFSNDSEYLDFLNVIKKRSNFDYQIPLSIEDKILTLSTCNADGSKRIVLHAKKIVED